MIDLAKLTNLSEQIQARVRPPQQATGKSWYRITNRAPQVAEIYIYDGIGEWGVSARDFVADLRAVKASRIELHVNSPGGQVFDGVAIYNALVNHPAEVTVHIDALAASAASFIAMAGNEIVIEKNARMMIHDAAGLCIGNARDMRELADLLDSLSDTIAEVYADRTGTDKATWREAMLAETWYPAAEAVAAGLADRVAGETTPDPDQPSDAALRPPTNAAATGQPEPDNEGEPDNAMDLDLLQTLMKEAFGS